MNRLSLANLQNFNHQRDVPWHVGIVIAPTTYERKRFFEFLLKEERICFFDGESGNFAKFLSELRTEVLFAKEKFLALDQCEQLSEAEQKILAAWCEKPLAGVRVLLGASGKTASLSLYKNADFLLDVTKEKPWDKLGFFVKHLCASAGKRLAPGVERLLFQMVGYDLAVVEREIQKLLIFTGERLEISESDVMAMCHSSRKNLYRSVEALVWEGKPITHSVDATEIYSMISYLRSQLEQKLRVLLLFAQRKTERAIRAELGIEARIGLQHVEKCTFAQCMTSLRVLFELEYAAKRGRVPVELLTPILSSRIAS